MDFVEVRVELTLDEYNNDKLVNNVIKMYSARLKDTIFDDDKVILILMAPSTWKILLMQSILGPYRYM